MEFLTSIGGALSGLATTLMGFAVFRMGRGKNAPATVKEAQAIGRFYRILPRLTRGQIRKLLQKLGVKKAFTDAEINALKNKLQKQGQGLTREALYTQIIQNRATSIGLFVRNPNNMQLSAKLHSNLTPAELEKYGKYIDQYIVLTEKYGNATWATKWFR